MAEASSNTGTAKKRFSIPTIDDISRYEAQRPKIPSGFKTGKNQQASSSGNANLQPSSSGNATCQDRTLVNTNSHDSQPKSAHRTVGKSVVNPYRRVDTPPNPESDLVSNSKNSVPSSSSSSLPSTSSSSSVPVVPDQSNLDHGTNNVSAATTRTDSEGQSLAGMPSTSLSDGQNARPPHPPGGSNVKFMSATDFVKKRGKIGSAFAEKFKNLGKAEDYKEPQALVKQSTTQPLLPGQPSTASTSNKAASGNSIIVNPRQRGNPILKHIRNVPWEFGDVVPDYVMGRTTCALYLSLRYHHLNPNYIHDRLRELGHRFDLRVLLVQVDVKVPHHAVKELARMAILADCTLILAWSAEEAGRYLETYKAYENKPADALKVKVEQDHVSRMTDCLTTVKSVNKTDVITLLANYGTFEKIADSSKEDLALLPGFGPQKAQRLNNIFTEPFLRKNKRRKLQEPDDVDAT